VNSANARGEDMSGSRASVDNLIDDIRSLYNKSKASCLDISCDLVDKKLEKRSSAQQRQLARNVARAAKQFDEMFRKRSFYEKMIERSKTVNALISSSDRQCSTHGNNSCPCESSESVSLSKNLHPKKVGSVESCSYGKIPQVFFFISLSMY
jgi:hypothetical protein